MTYLLQITVAKQHKTIKAINPANLHTTDFQRCELFTFN